MMKPSLAVVLGFVVALVVVIGDAAVAQACGVWKMHDVEKQYDVRWLINSASITKRSRRIAAFHLDESKDPVRVVRGRKTVLDIAGGNLRKRGRRIGTVSSREITIGKRAYTLAFEPAEDLHDMKAWKLTVSRGDDVVITSDQAVALCRRPGTTVTDESAQSEIATRVAYYLAWREGRF